MQPTLGPDATGVGWVFQYALVDRSGNHNLAELRSLQDFKLRYWLESVEGVAEVASVGGFVKEYQIQLDPNKLAAYGIPLKKVTEAVRRSNNDIGGRVLEIAGHEQFIRGRGYIKNRGDIEEIAIGLGKKGIPILLKDVAVVSLGPAMRRGIAELDGEGEVVGGTVVMRYGEDALGVIERVKQRLVEAQAALPEGVEIITVYDRSELINQAIDTLKQTLTEEMIVVSLIIMVFLLHFRSALIAILTLPVAILLSFIPMSGQNLTANIMSLGGIAVAIGAMVDASIVMIENIHKRLEEWAERHQLGSRTDVIIRAMQEVGPSIFFSLLIITVSFLPVFALEGTEGRLFKPLAYTKTYSMGFAALLAITFTPALAVLLIRGKIRGDKSWINRALVAVYTPIVRLAVKLRWWVVGGAVAALLATVPVFMELGNEFMPPLNEGTILYMPTAVPGMPIQTRTEMLATGIRSTLGIKVFGDDLETVEATGIRIEQALQDDERTAPYTRSAFAERISGGYFLDFDIDRKKIARYGLTIADVEDVIMAAVGGITVSETIEGRERYAINLRYARDFRDDPQALKRVLVPTPTGAQIPLAQLAELNFRTGPPMLRNENGQLVGYVFVDVNDKIGIADYVAAAKQVVAEQANVPPGYRLDWAGQFKYFERAKAKLMVVVPMTLFIIFFMLYINRKSVVESLIILLAVPFSLIGAVWLLVWLDYNLSVAVWVGMIALAGVDTAMGVLMMLYLGMVYRQRQADGRLQTRQDLLEVITEGAGRRIRPMLMTGLALLLGLIPILWSDGTGADVMERIAAPMVGGIASALITVLILFPAVFAIWKGWSLRSNEEKLREGKP